jgi:hypothetical protein
MLHRRPPDILSARWRSLAASVRARNIVVSPPIRDRKRLPAANHTGDIAGIGRKAARQSGPALADRVHGRGGSPASEALIVTGPTAPGANASRRLA